MSKLILTFFFIFSLCLIYTGQPFCTKCFRGRYSNVPIAKTLDVCESCTEGYYLDEEGKTSVVDCKRCPKGTYQKLLSAPSLHSCIKCTNGTFADTDTNIDSTACKDCSAGRYGDEKGMKRNIGEFDDPSDCKSCLLGRYGPNTGVGMISGCIKCIKGKYLDVTGQTSTNACKNCPAGRFGADSGAMNNAGTWVLVKPEDADADAELTERLWTFTAELDARTFTAKESCQPCFRGTYSSTLGLSSATDCIGCGAGKYQDQFEQLNDGSCKSCP